MQYFVSHQLIPENIDDLRRIIAGVFEPFGYKPFYADKALEGQPLLDKICQRIFLTSFSVFDLTSASPNVYLEMGIALGMNRPMIALARQGSPIPSALRSHNIILYANYLDLEAKLTRLCEQGFPSARQTLPDYCHFCGRVCDGMATMPDENSYLVLDHSRLLWRDLMRSIEPHLAKRQLHPIHLTEQSFGPLLCDMRRKVLSCQFAVCHLGMANETSFLALGMAIGSTTPWLLLSKKDSESVPSNLQGFGRIEYVSLADFARQLQETLDGFLEIVIPSPNHGLGQTAPIQARPFWVQLRDWIDNIPQATQTPEETHGRIRVIQYAGQRCAAKFIIPQEGMLFGRSAACDVGLPDRFVSLQHFRILSTRGRQYLIKDLGSKNGTLLNGGPLAPNFPTMLSVGDRIKLPGARTRFMIWDNRPLPEVPGSPVVLDTGTLPPILTIEIPDIPPPSSLCGVDLSLMLTALHPDGRQKIVFEVQTYYPLGKILSELVDLLDLPRKSYRFKVGNRLVGNTETPLSAEIKEGDSIIILPEKDDTKGVTARILLLDGDPNYRIIEKTFLEQEGYEVIIATDLNEARTLLQRERIDLAVVDPTLLLTPTDQDADHLVIAKDEAIRQLLSSPPDGLSPSLASASRIEGTGTLLQVIDRIMSNA